MIRLPSFKGPKISYEPLSELENEEVKQPSTPVQYCSSFHSIAIVVRKFILLLSLKGQKISYEPLSELENEEVKQPSTPVQYCSSFHSISFLAGCLFILLGGFAYRIFVVDAEVQQSFSPIP